MNKNNSRYCAKCNTVKFNTEFTTINGKVFSRCKQCVNNYYSNEKIIKERKAKYANKKIDELIKIIESQHPAKLEEINFHLDNMKDVEVKQKLQFLKEQMKIFNNAIIEIENTKILLNVLEYIKKRFPELVDEVNVYLEQNKEISFEKKIKNIKNRMHTIIKNI